MQSYDLLYTKIQEKRKIRKKALTLLRCMFTVIDKIPVFTGLTHYQLLEIISRNLVQRLLSKQQLLSKTYYFRCF